jgi:hypothetical protein
VNRPGQDPAPQTPEAAGDDVIWGATGRIVYQFLKAWEEAG